MQTTQPYADEISSYPAAERTVVTDSRPRSGGASIIAIVVIILVVGAAGFFGGVQYQKSSASSTVATTGQAGAGGFGGQAMNGGFGTVTAVGSNSVSVQDQRQNATKTYSISSGTIIVNGSDSSAQTATTSSATTADISVGDNIMVQISGSTSTAATRIVINPTMGGGPGAQNGTGGSST